jgi:Natural resistance-associated macrophage protein/Transposase DDE domain
MIDRERAGRSADPSAAILDRQTVKAPAAGGTCGFDGAKKIVGRKRHIAVDTDGRLLMVNLTTGDIADSTGAQAVMDAHRQDGAVAFVVHVPWRLVLYRTFVPNFSLKTDYVVTVVAVLGTAITPYCFFWQSSQEAEDERVDPHRWGPTQRWLNVLPVTLTGLGGTRSGAAKAIR